MKAKIFLIIFIFLSINLLASTYKWTANINKDSAYVNEAIYLKYTCEFSDIAQLYAIDFNPLGTYDKYDVLLLSEDERIIDGKKINTYEFVVYAKEPGRLEFNFDTVMKKTTKGSIESTVLGRDNMQKEQFVKIPMKQKILSIEIKDINTKLVGDFDITLKKDKLEKKAYEPFHMELIIKGHGDFQRLKALSFEIEDVKIFSQKPIVKTKLTKNGYKGIWSQKFAFVSGKDFVVPSFKIKYTNPKTKIEEDYVSKDIKIKIIQAYKKAELLDEEEKKFDFSFDFVYYILTFIAGFLLGKIKFKRDIVEDNDYIFKEKVTNANTLDELLILLVLKDPNKYKNLIEGIEKSTITSVSKAKNEFAVYK